MQDLALQTVTMYNHAQYSSLVCAYNDAWADLLQGHTGQAVASLHCSGVRHDVLQPAEDVKLSEGRDLRLAPGNHFWLPHMISLLRSQCQCQLCPSEPLPVTC